ncbi:MAG: hypothetical protein WAO28_04585 [Candidatus Microsaccharimonas sp.]
MKEHPVRQFIPAFAIFTTAVFVVSYGVVTSYYSGYLDYFGINIRYIDFWPHLPDFMLVAAPIIMAIIFMGLASGLAMFLFNHLGKWLARKSKMSFIREFGKSLIWQPGIGLLAILVTLFIGTFSITYVTQEKSGRDFAENQTQFIRVGPDGKKVEILVYQNGGTAFTKTYDKESKQFETGYKTVSFVGQNLEQIELSKN